MMYLTTYLAKNRVEDEEAVVTEVGKQFLVVYSKKLGIMARCYYERTGPYQTEWKEKSLEVTWNIKSAAPSTENQTPELSAEPKKTSYTYFQKVKVYFRPTTGRPADVEAVLLLY